MVPNSGIWGILGLGGAVTPATVFWILRSGLQDFKASGFRA